MSTVAQNELDAQELEHALALDAMKNRVSLLISRGYTNPAKILKAVYTDPDELTQEEIEQIILVKLKAAVDGLRRRNVSEYIGAYMDRLTAFSDRLTDKVFSNKLQPPDERASISQAIEIENTKMQFLSNLGVITKDSINEVPMLPEHTSMSELPLPEDPMLIEARELVGNGEA